MKNFSTVMAHAAAVALLACAASGAAVAQTDTATQSAACAFRPDAPDKHVVVKRDTLWDISASSCATHGAGPRSGA